MRFDTERTMARGYGVFRSELKDMSIRECAFLGSSSALLTLYLLRVKAIDEVLSAQSPSVLRFPGTASPARISPTVRYEQLPSELGICHELADNLRNCSNRTEGIDPCYITQDRLRAAYRGKDISYLIAACDGFTQTYELSRQDPGRSVRQLLLNPTITC